MSNLGWILARNSRNKNKIPLLKWEWNAKAGSTRRLPRYKARLHQPLPWQWTLFVHALRPLYPPYATKSWTAIHPKGSWTNDKTRRNHASQVSLPKPKHGWNTNLKGSIAWKCHKTCIRCMTTWTRQTMIRRTNTTLPKWQDERECA